MCLSAYLGYNGKHLDHIKFGISELNLSVCPNQAQPVEEVNKVPDVLSNVALSPIGWGGHMQSTGASPPVRNGTQMRGAQPCRAL